jgi:ATP-dependent RNA circularization protein (DNA/RNA ligase family)
LNDLVEVRVDGRLGDSSRSMLLGVLPLHYSNGKTVKRSVETIRNLEQEIMDDLILSQEGKSPSEFSYSTSIAYIWDRRTGFLQGFEQKLQGTPGYLMPRVLREGKVPVRVA